MPNASHTFMPKYTAIIPIPQTIISATLLLSAPNFNCNGMMTAKTTVTRRKLITTDKAHSPTENSISLILENTNEKTETAASPGNVVTILNRYFSATYSFRLTGSVKRYPIPFSNSS